MIQHSTSVCTMHRTHGPHVWTLTHWGRVTHICVSELTTIGSDNGLSPSRRQAIIWTNAGILSIRPSGANFSEILIEIDTFSFKKMHVKILSGKWRPSCLGPNVLPVHPNIRLWHRGNLSKFTKMRLPHTSDTETERSLRRLPYFHSISH